MLRPYRLILTAGLISLVTFTGQAKGINNMPLTTQGLPLIDFEQSDLVQVSLEQALKFKVPKTLEFSIDREPAITSQTVTLTGYLTNNGNKAEKIIVFPVEMVSPFYAQLKTNQQIVFVTKPEDMMPPVPPPPMQMVVPAKTIIVFRSQIKLDPYHYTGSPAAEINWSFNYWNELKPNGLIKLGLPKRD